MDELTREFLIESQEGLDRMERCLTELEERPQDAGLIGEIFRSVHTIKGTTGFLGFKRLEKLAHAGENLLGLLREGKATADQAITTGLLQLMDCLRAILRTIEAEGAEGDGEDIALIDTLEKLQARDCAPVHAADETRQAATESSKPRKEAPKPLPAAQPRAVPPPASAVASNTPFNDRVPESPCVDARSKTTPMPPNRAAPQPTPPRKARCASM